MRIVQAKERAEGLWRSQEAILGELDGFRVPPMPPELAPVLGLFSRLGRSESGAILYQERLAALDGLPRQASRRVGRLLDALENERVELSYRCVNCEEMRGKRHPKHCEFKSAVD